MSKFIITSVLCFFLQQGFLKNTIQAAEDPGMAKLRKNLIESLLNNRHGDEGLTKILSLLKPDGSFSDLDYSDRTRGGWSLNDHLSRTLSMAIAWKSPQSPDYKSTKLRNPLFSALNHWLNHDYINPNWWYPEIGIPRVLGQIMLLLKEDLSEQELKAGLKILDRAKLGKTGQNKVWLAQNVIYRSLLVNDFQLIQLAAKAISDEVVVTESEGIQPDFSFHQHGPQQQFGNYGLAFAGDMCDWAIIFEGTPFAFDAQKIAILRDYLLKGLKWVVWKNKFDISACGRQLFPNAQIGKARSLTNILKAIPRADPSFTAEYKSALNDFDGNIHFWRSDMTIHRREGFYASVKMASNRVAGAESCNSENIQGYHMGDGATFFYQSAEEYLDIFPFWDWKKIPGTTAFQDDSTLPVLTASGYRIKSDFVGGVSDGLNGVATLQYTRDSLQANKSWFFFDDAIICLGSGIKTTKEKNVTTAVNQSLLKSKVVISQKAKSTTLKNGVHELKNTEWVIQDNWGYFFPGGANVNIGNNERTGAWNRVVEPMSAKPLKTEMFQLWIDHGNKPQNGSYSYIVLPKASPENIRKRGTSIAVISNSESIQAVKTISGTYTGIVFYQKGSCRFDAGRSITTDQPCIVLLTSKNGKDELNISDPSHLLSDIHLTISGKTSLKSGEMVTVEHSANLTTIAVKLPRKGMAGRTVTVR